MKKLLIISTMIMLVMQSNAQFAKATLQATGLTCAMCSNAINKALMQVAFVESVRSDIKNSAFSIVFKQGQEVEIDALRKEQMPDSAAGSEGRSPVEARGLFPASRKQPQPSTAKQGPRRHRTLRCRSLDPTLCPHGPRFVAASARVAAAKMPGPIGIGDAGDPALRA